MQIRRGFEVRSGMKFLVVEDVVTTGGSVQEVMDCVRKMGGTIAGVGTIVDRSKGKTAFDADHFSVAELDVVTYTPDMCPQCAKGSTPVKPGSRGS
jgi:orotate phosphoribosyltransferase